MAHELIAFIKEHGLEQLEHKYFIKVKRHSEFNNLVLLKYNQLESPLGVKMVQQCRGIILDEANNWRVISYPYDKFFNYGEGHAADINWENARVYEKLDGSLMTLYYYDLGWHVATSGTPDASGDVLNTGTSFGDLFWKVWNELGYELPTDENVCYMFEMMTMFNRVVVRHPENRIALHGARRLSDFRELNPIVEAHNHGWEVAKIFPLGSWDEIVEAAKTLEPMESEGYVVADTSYNRVKVKSPQYVAIAHIKDTFSTRRILEIVRTNENAEFLAYYPEYTDIYWEIRCKYERLLGQIEGAWEAIKHIDDRKSFALLAKDLKFSGGLFGMKFGKFESFKEYLAGMNIKYLEDWLDIRLINL
ncbi:MAG: RNA ligase [Promethearchaeota archaeon]|jgi:hypothetical protein